MPYRLDIYRGLQQRVVRQYESGEESETKVNHPVMLDTIEMSCYATWREIRANQDRAILHSSFIFHCMLQQSSSYPDAVLMYIYRKVMKSHKAQPMKTNCLEY
jgi:hypothetical protein